MAENRSFVLRLLCGNLVPRNIGKIGVEKKDWIWYQVLSSCNKQTVNESELNDFVTNSEKLPNMFEKQLMATNDKQKQYWWSTYTSHVLCHVRSYNL